MTNENVVADNKVVDIAYTLWVDDKVYDSSDASDPLKYLHGHNNIIPGLENAIVGMKIGEKKSVVVEPKDGYGEISDDEPISLDRSMFPAGFDLTVGNPLHLQDEDTEQIITAYIVDYDDNVVKVDLNHPLAGKTLAFDIEVIDLRDALPMELRHGHPHTGCSSCAGCGGGCY